MSILISVLSGQVSTQSTPKSLQYNIPMDISIEKLDEFDVQDFIEEDKINNNLKTNPYRFANSIEVNFNMNNSGKWIKANDGTNIWRLIIQSKNAYSLNAIYDKFHIPKGSEFFVYSLFLLILVLTANVFVFHSEVLLWIHWMCFCKFAF